jgi:predicted ATPase
VRRVEERSTDPLARGSWPATLPVVAALLDGGLDLGPATVFVGDNGVGKSTVVEGIAMAFGLGAEGGSQSIRRETRASESPLSEHLQIVRSPGGTRYGYFLRAETMHGLYTYLEENPPAPGRAEPRFHEMSHGESFLAMIDDRFRDAGLWVLDEPESALSFTGCMRLLGVLKELLADDRNQVILSTHSPLLAALPGATIYEVGDWGLRRCDWADTDLVRIWSSFLDGPERFLRYL